jgi:hypothetical protein
MTLQIFMKGPRVWKIQNDSVSATTVNATGTKVYYYDGEQNPNYLGCEIFTTAAANGGNFVTATGASATIETFADMYMPGVSGQIYIVHLPSAT